MLAEPGRVGVAVSGGADSVALLHALRELYPERALCVIHLNHCLRGRQSDRDETFVRGLAERSGHACFVRRDDVARAAAEHRLNLEQAGRRCRYRFFREMLAEDRCCVVATAHTRSDQAETVLFRLFRGAGGAGLSGIWPALATGIVRPMLDVSRTEVLAFLRERGIAWREDPSNADVAFARNRLRHGLLPALRRDWNPNIEATLAGTADWAVEEERFWRLRTRELRNDCLRETPGGALLDVDAARALHTAELRRLLDSILKRPPFGKRPAGFGHVEALRSLIWSPSGSGTVDLPGGRAQRSFGSVRFQAGRPSASDGFDLPLPVPGIVELPPSDAGAVRARVLRTPETPSLYNRADTALLDWDSLRGPLRLRNWRPGDRYRPAGTGSSRKIKDLFQRNRVSAWDRADWPVVVTARSGAGLGRIVWARAFGPAAEFAAGPGSRRLLALDEVSGAHRSHVS